MLSHLSLKSYKTLAPMIDLGWQGSVDNLLINCIGDSAEERLLIVAEPEGEQMYDHYPRFDGVVTATIEDDLEDWNSVLFSSPRYLHFHTCGDLTPCEITWSVFNPTVIIDGEAFWNDGQFCWLQRPETVN